MPSRRTHPSRTRAHPEHPSARTQRAAPRQADPPRAQQARSERRRALDAALHRDANANARFADAPQAGKAGKAAPDQAPDVGASLHRLRADRGLSLEKLSRAADVSRAMLGQIELGQSAPTIKTLWKIARALDVPFSALLSPTPAGGTQLLRAAETRRLTNRDGSFVSRALFPLGGPRRVEFYELTLAGLAEERAVPHPAGTLENLTLSRGRVQIDVGSERYSLEPGDVLTFEADVPHAYRNPARQPALMYLVMTYSHAPA